MSARGVLIVGGSGFVGTHLSLKLREGYRVIATFHSRRVPIPGVLSLPLDFREENWIKTLFYRLKPEVIIYLPTIQDLEWVERNGVAAEKIVAGGMGDLMRVADILQPRLIFLSSDQVFDGSRGNYQEKDPLTPHNPIGRIKAGAENFVRTRSSIHTLFRCSPLLGCSNPHRPSFLDQIRTSLSRNQRIELQDYELHSFGSVDDLATLVDQAIQGAPRRAVYHYGGLTRLTHYEVAVKFARMHGFDASLISPRKRTSRLTADSKLDFSLNSSEVIHQFGLKPREAEEILRDLRIS